MPKKMHPISENKRSGRQWKCPSCGNVNGLKSKDCLRCGIAQIPTQNRSWICPVCENINSGYLRYCPICSTPHRIGKSHSAMYAIIVSLCVIVILLIAVFFTGLEKRSKGNSDYEHTTLPSDTEAASIIQDTPERKPLSTSQEVIWELDFETYTVILTGEGPMDDYGFSVIADRSHGSLAPWKFYTGKIKATTIAEDITTISDCAFYNCISLTSISLPSTLCSIGYGSFAYCESLDSIVLPDGITEIGAYAFYSCNNLTDFYVPKGVKVVNSCTFAGCNNLLSVAIPSSVKKICNGAFDYCGRLTDVYYEGTKAQWEQVEIEAFGSYGASDLENATIHYESY